jgi:predicted ATPase
VLRGLFAFYEVRSELGKSRLLAERLLALAQRTQDPALLLEAHLTMTITSLARGEPAASREHMEQGVAVYDPRRHSSHSHLYGLDPGVSCPAFGSVALWLLGFPDQAVERSRQAVALSGELGQPSPHTLAMYFAAMLRQYRHEVPAVLESAEAIMTIATEHGFSFWLGQGQMMRAWALAEQGQPANGIALLRQGLTAWMETGSKTYATYFLALLAEALGEEGNFKEGLSVLAEALARVESQGEGFHAAELHRLRGEFLLRHEPSEATCLDAEDCFRHPLAIARGQQAKSLELRTAMSLFRLYQMDNRQAEARPMLAQCYDWFTEGFDTSDLKEAKALLEQVS